MKRILAISGGGMRGVVPARFLIEIENRTGRKIAEIFSLIAGTSTGSILAALCCRPFPTTAELMMRFYYESGPRIFRRGWFDWGVFGPKYSQADLHRELRACIGESKCGDIARKLLIPTVDANQIEAVFIKSWDRYWAEYPLWAAAASSCSAQTFFPAHSGIYGMLPFRHIDGGNHTNNPAASALFEAYRLWPNEEILVVHLGTGKQRNPRPLPDGGIARWAPLVFGATSECQDDCARYLCIHAPGVRFFSFDVSIDRFPAMDDASRDTLDDLIELAERQIDADSQRWEDLIASISALQTT